MAKDIDPRLAFRRVQNFAEEYSLPDLEDWLDVEYVKDDDSDNWNFTLHAAVDKTTPEIKLTVPDGSLAVDDLFAARKYEIRGQQPFDPEITIDSPGKGLTDAEIKERDEAMPTVAEAMAKADAAIGGRDKLFPPPVQPSLTRTIIKGIRKFVNKYLRGRF